MLILLFFNVYSKIIAFDLGVQYIKLGTAIKEYESKIFKNDVSEPKTKILVSFQPAVEINTTSARNIVRNVGDLAYNTLLKDSKVVVRAISDILGKNSSETVKQQLKKRYIDFYFDNNTVNGLEIKTILAMLFESMLYFPKKEYNITSAIVSVPSFFTDYQKFLVADSLRMIGLDCFGIVTDLYCLSMRYGIDKLHFFKNKNRTVTFLHFGTSSLTIGTYNFFSKVLPRENQQPVLVPALETIHSYWNDTIGGIDFDIKIAEKFKDDLKLKEVSQTLIADAEKIKQKLTVGKSATLVSDSTGDKLSLSRNDFFAVSEEIVAKLRDILTEYKIYINNTDFIEVAGGATKIPCVINVIKEVFNKTIGKAVDQDHSIIDGALYSTKTNVYAQLLRANSILKYSYNTSILIGDREIPLFNSSNLIKPRKVSLNVENEKEFSIIVTSKVPYGASRLIGTWEFPSYKGTSADKKMYRITFAPNKFGVLDVTKSMIVYKNGSDFKKETVTLKRTFPPASDPEKERIDLEIIGIFSTAELDKRKLHETQNAYEQKLYNLSDKSKNELDWKKGCSPKEWKEITDYIQKEIKNLPQMYKIENISKIYELIDKLEEMTEPSIRRGKEYGCRPIFLNLSRNSIKDFYNTVEKEWARKGIAPSHRSKKRAYDRVAELSRWVDEKTEELSKKKSWEPMSFTCDDIRSKMRKLDHVFRSLKNRTMKNKEL